MFPDIILDLDDPGAGMSRSRGLAAHGDCGASVGGEKVAEVQVSFLFKKLR